MDRKAIRFFPIFLTVFIDFLGIALVVPIFAPMLLEPMHGAEVLDPSTSLNARGILLGFLTACYPIGQFMGSPFLGRLSDRHGRKPWLVWSIGGTCFGYILSAMGVWFGNLTLLFVGRFVTGFNGGNSSVCQSAVADLYDEQHRGTYFGLLAFAMGLGFILGPVVGGRLADPDLVSWFNYDTPFWVSAIMAAFNLLLMTYLFKETIKVKRKVSLNPIHGVVDICKVLLRPGINLAMLVFFFFTLGWFFFAQFFQVYLIQKFQFTQVEIGDTFTYIAVWYAILQGAIAAPISHWFRPKPLALIALPFMALSLLALLVPGKSVFLLVIYPFLVLCVCVAWPNILAVISNLASSDEQGEVLGVGQSVQSLAQAITPIASGPLVAHFFRMPTYIGAACSGLAFLLLIFVRKKEK